MSDAADRIAVSTWSLHRHLGTTYPHKIPADVGTVGNPDLKPETSVQLDLAGRYASPRAQVGVFFYNYRITDLIERYQREPDVFYFRNRGRARLRGFEIEARTDLSHGYSVEVGTQIARGRALDDDAPLDDISPVTFSVSSRPVKPSTGA